jgi:hypothetical protein
MIKNIRGSIMAVEVLPEYETETEQEIDIYLESGPTIEMFVTSDEARILKQNIGTVANFDISDVTLCGVHARATNFQFE